MFKAWQKAGIFDRLVIVMHGDHGSKIDEHRAAYREYLLRRLDAPRDWVEDGSRG